MDGDTIELFRKDCLPAYSRLDKPKSRKSWIILWLQLSLFILISVSGFVIFYKLLFRNLTSTVKVRIQVPVWVSNISIKIPAVEATTIAHHLMNVNGECDGIADASKFDCLPTEPINQEECLNRGCCWHSRNAVFPPLKTPYCYYPKNYAGYKIVTVHQDKYSLVAYLKRVNPSGYPYDVKLVKLEVNSIDSSNIQVKLSDPNVRRYEVPLPKLNIPKNHIYTPLYTFTIINDGLLTISRVNTSRVIFKTDLKRLIFSDQYLELTNHMPTKYVYGLGEHKAAFRKELTWARYTMFNRDEAPRDNINLYGSHPFYLAFDDDEGKYDGNHGVLLFNSNAMDIITQPEPAITYRTIGGVLDFYIFLGPSPSDVVRQFINLIGKPELPPYWGLGFQLCRYGYASLNETRETLQRNRDAGIPIDVQWNDIDYMDKFKDFTYDKIKFDGLPEFVDELHNDGLHYVMMFDPGLSAGEKRGTYPPFDKGDEMNIFVKNSTNDNFIGMVWTKTQTVWPDFSNPNAVTYWMEQMKDFHDKIKYDGAWIDMNEPSNFYSGSVYGCPNNSIENPKYKPGSDILRRKTLCMNSKQFAGLHYDVHNLYGTYEAEATNIALKKIRNKRPFIISRASTIGLGNFAGHWSGDLFATFDQMKWSISSILNFNMFGVPLVGADICGFNGNTSIELCARWSALGAFYPFSRNHNSNDCMEQDPYALGPIVVSAARNALLIRYSLLPYFYTQFYRAHLFGDTTVRPLFFEFPNDLASRAIDTQFMWGARIMVLPILNPSKTKLNAYFPSGKWYDFVGQTLLINSKGENKTLDVPLDDIRIALRGGNIVATQVPKNTTTETRKGKFVLVAGLDVEEMACGELYWDDGDSIDTKTTGNYTHLLFSIKKNTLTIYSEPYKRQYKNMTLGDVAIIGVKNVPTTLSINSKMYKNFNYDAKNERLRINQIDVDMLQKIVISWK